MREELKKLLIKRAGVLTRELNTIHQILGGVSQKEACRINNVNYLTFNKGLRKTYKDFFADKPDIPHNAYLIASDYERLFAYCKANGEARSWSIRELVPGIEICIIPQNDYMPENVNENMPKVLQKISEREKKVLWHRGVEKLTIDEVGRKYLVSRERIRQIEISALRRLNQPSILCELMLGKSIDDINKENKQKVEKAKEEAQKECVRLFESEKENAFLYFRLHPEEIGNLIEVKEEKTEIIPPLSCINISQLNLSVRAKNCLARAGLKTVWDVQKAGPEVIRGLRNMGIRTYEEVARLMAGYGVFWEEDA